EVGIDPPGQVREQLPGCDGELEPVYWYHPFIREVQALSRGHQDLDSGRAPQEGRDQLGTIQEVFEVVEYYQHPSSAQVGEQVLVDVSRRPPWVQLACQGREDQVRRLNA